SQAAAGSQGRPPRLIASQQVMGSQDGKCLIERHNNQRFRWSERMWSPPPESNRRPHPYHGTTRNRCANRRFPSSGPTVGAKVKRSLNAKLWVLLLTRRACQVRASALDPAAGLPHPDDMGGVGQHGDVGQRVAI